MKIRNAFIAAREPIDLVEGDSLTDSWLYSVDGYTPRLFRRRRLHRFAPLARRVAVVVGLWRFLGAP